MEDTVEEAEDKVEETLRKQKQKQTQKIEGKNLRILEKKSPENPTSE